MIVYLHPPSTAAHKQPMAFNFNDDLVAQLVEHLPFKERVLGSSPSQVTKQSIVLTVLFFFTVHLHFYRDAGIGRQAWLRAMCPLGRVGSTPIPGTKRHNYCDVFLLPFNIFL